MNDVRFCWLCGNKLYGNHRELLEIDSYPTTLHKQCAKTVRTEYDFKKVREGKYVSMVWEPSGSLGD